MTEVFEETTGCIKVAVTGWPPMVDVSTNPFKGYYVTTFREFMAAMKMCYWLIATPDQQWGDKRPNGSWTGMVGEVGKKNTNMALGPLGVTWLRTEVLDFMYPNMNCINNFLYKQVKVQPDMLIFLNSFQKQVWFYTAAVTVLISIASIIFHFGYNSSRESPSDRAMQTEKKLSKDSAFLQFLWGFRIFLLQDSMHAPRGDAGRFISLTWMLATLILTLMYKCNLKAILITSKAVPPFDSMEDFVNQDEYKWTIVAGTYYGAYFRNEHEVAPDTPRGRMHPLRTPFDLAKADDTVQVVTEQKVAAVAPQVFHEGSIADDFSQNGECSLTYTTRGFHDLHLAFGIEKKYPLKEKMDITMMRLLEAGIPDHIMHFELRNASWCTNPPKKTDDTRPFSIGDFYGILIIYLIGNAIGIFLFFVEIFAKQCNLD